MTSAALILLALVVIAELWLVNRRPRYVDDRQPADYERLASWERRMGEHRASERMRQHRALADFDARAVVQPKVCPRLPR